MKKRILSMFLCMALMIGCMPFVEAASKPGNSKETAVQITMGTTYNYQWTYADNSASDLYVKVTLPQRGVLNFSGNKLADPSGEEESVKFYIYNQSDTVNAIWEEYSSHYTYLTEYNFNIGLNAGTYYFKIAPSFYLKNGESRSMGYKFSFTANNSFETEPNNGNITATALTLNSRMNAYIDDSDDYFKITVTKDTPVRLKIGNYLELKNKYSSIKFVLANGTSEYISSYDLVQAGNYHYYNCLLKKGTNYISVGGSSDGASSYWLEPSTSITIPTPVINNLSVSGSTVTINWAALTGIDGYEIWRSINGGTWELVEDCSSYYTGISQWGTDFNKSYQFKVKAYKKFGETKFYGDWSVIKALNPTPTNVKLSATSYSYNGKVITPSVTIKDKTGKKLTKNVDYTVNYASGRKKVGTYKVTITFKGNYSGTVTKTFKINPKKASLKSLSKGKKQIKVKWSKVTSETTGYQIQYSTSSKFKSAKTVTIKKNKTTSTTIKSLKSNKKYYVRVRTYKTVKSTKYYSSWSNVKNVKTK